MHMSKWKLNTFSRLIETTHYQSSRFLRSSLSQRMKDVWLVYFGEDEAREVVSQHDQSLEKTQTNIQHLLSHSLREHEVFRYYYLLLANKNLTLNRFINKTHTDVGLVDYFTLARLSKGITKSYIDGFKIQLELFKDINTKRKTGVFKTIPSLLVQAISAITLAWNSIAIPLTGIVTAALYAAKIAITAALTLTSSIFALLVHAATASKRAELKKAIDSLEVIGNSDDLEDMVDLREPLKKSVGALLKKKDEAFWEVTRMEKSHSSSPTPTLVLEGQGLFRIPVDHENRAGIKALLQLNFFRTTNMLENTKTIDELERQLEAVPKFL